MRKFNRTKIDRKGPREIRANFITQEKIVYTLKVKEIVDGELVERDEEKETTKPKLNIGFSGYKGFRYHPTKGWKKEAGFRPSV